VISYHHACFFACELTRHAGLDAADLAEQLVADDDLSDEYLDEEEELIADDQLAADSDEPADTPAFAYTDADIAKAEAGLAPIPPSPAAASTLSAPANGQPPAIDSSRLDREIAEMDLRITLARSVQLDEKTRALVTALRLGLEQLASSDARRKAVNFTESRRTQEYLKRSLEATGRLGKAVLFNGSLGGPAEQDIYGKREAVNRPLGRLSGSRVAARRQSILEHFRDGADILFATERAAEGINFQFCSLVIIYDLQWNQQRIGRCHRYGQTHDVVLNFLNQANAATKFRCSNSISSTSRTPTTAACMRHVSKSSATSSPPAKSARPSGGPRTRWSRSVSTATATIPCKSPQADLEDRHVLSMEAGRVGYISKITLTSIGNLLIDMTGGS
jgi:hypothetical protein